ELDVLADDRDPGLAGGGVDATDDLLPGADVRGRSIDAEVVEDALVDELLLVPEGDLVDVTDVLARDHHVLLDRRRMRDLGADVAAQLGLGAADQHVGLEADATQLVDRVLGRLGLQLAGVLDVRHQGQVDVHAVAAADVDRELADRLEERQRLDVADRAADLADHDVDVARLARELDPVLDLVGDVRDDLDRAAQVVAAPLAADHR